MFDREINTVDELSFNVLWCNKLVIYRHKECSICFCRLTTIVLAALSVVILRHILTALSDVRSVCNCDKAT